MDRDKGGCWGRTLFLQRIKSCPWGFPCGQQETFPRKKAFSFVLLFGAWLLDSTALQIADSSLQSWGSSPALCLEWIC